ncbi:hypothetical protein [Geosporobacter ferrireducens]|uniref:Uncharacterized protein n=1 Tax=Geosporobacter ferrireducens TaxID=1424294 RepID=A0A1D8GC43_9FIRM|nr:hypothetical protein [Geosporobacter ferrireducens]AOT68494.1 hypothetical protein Gferi_02130 [Geosporobacter ferrireducens]MTI53956.1 hypothetical protein [Geosporobacter ferrireducens]
MLPIYAKNKGRKTFPITEKINTFKLMNFVKALQDITRYKFHCQVYTKNMGNSWSFRYTAQNKILITISFHDDAQEDCSYIYIQDFNFPKSCIEKQMDQKILKLFLQHFQNLDFDMLRFRLLGEETRTLSQHFAFRRTSLDEAYMSLKTVFIPLHTNNVS